MKRTDVERKVREAAREAGIPIYLSRGARHDRLAVGGVAVTIPRHREINEYTAKAILKAFDPVFGKGWWR